MAVVNNLQLVEDDDEEEDGDEGFGILIHGIEDAINAIFLSFSLFVPKFCLTSLRLCLNWGVRISPGQVSTDRWL